MNGCVAAACGLDLCFANVCFACVVDIFPWENPSESTE
jgi:hypothetical protein